MRKAVFTIMLAVPFLLLAEPPTFFSNVTNLWFQGHKSNVLAIAEERLACNSNDIAGLILRLEYDLEFTNLASLSNSVLRTIECATNISCLNGGQLKFSDSLESLLDDMATDPIPAEEMEAERARALLPGKRFLFEKRLLAICLDGLVTNYPPLSPP